MSHSDGRIYKDGKVIAYYEYNGTCDVCISCLHETEDYIHKEDGDDGCRWRDHKWNNCTCGKSSIDVFIYTSYGGGFYWPGSVCLDCKAITRNGCPYYDNINCEEYLCNKYGCSHWPKDGKPEEDKDA